MKVKNHLEQLFKGRLRFYAVGFFAGFIIFSLTGALLLGTVHYTSTTSFCISCHEMKDTHRELMASGHGANRSGFRAECADCHISAGLSGMVRAKWTGLQELKIHVCENPGKDMTKWEARRQELKKKVAREMPNENCTKCHQIDAMRCSTKAGETAHRTITGETRCLDCHSVEGLQFLVHNRVESH
jgi:nitrate/TMAO reductase-like tetraheme cytochrome c subunit